METVIVAPEGDVILVVGADKKRLRVSSTFLSQSSSVFKAMFSGKFAEGEYFRIAEHDSCLLTISTSQV